MYYHHQAGASSSAVGPTKHDGGPNGAGPGWGRHPTVFTPSMPLPSQNGFPNGLGVFGPPPNPPHHQVHTSHTHAHPLHQHHTGQTSHHPSFGAGGMHLAQQTTGGMGMHPGNGYGMGMYGNGVQNGQGSPPRQPGEQQMPMTHYWQHQLMRAD
ncbi:hypothetical protein TREMEDRAFT_36469, partial [Tremella mesenterica DSM 1558]|uniref:uncharacterized protein n=1 Tax=Tremella mesenterica (strain ATCC 24925 / CBS 8224 / DSM 1558 / NBRC 9311 / NRRL Y-6157 / RJB 2259-6 / UBC 559-6) TaxID=578456 RepID=UPI0003F48C21